MKQKLIESQRDVMSHTHVLHKAIGVDLMQENTRSYTQTSTSLVFNSSETFFPGRESWSRSLEVYDHPARGRVKAGKVCGVSGDQYGRLQSAAELLSQNNASLGLGGLGNDQELSSSEPIR